MHGKNHTSDEGADCGRAASRASRTWMSLIPGPNKLRSKFDHQIIGWKAAFVLSQTVLTRGDTHYTNVSNVLKIKKDVLGHFFPKNMNTRFWYRSSVRLERLLMLAIFLIAVF